MVMNVFFLIKNTSLSEAIWIQTLNTACAGRSERKVVDSHKYTRMDLTTFVSKRHQHDFYI